MARFPTGSGPQTAGFLSRNGRIAQLVEQLTLNQRVLGSSPSASTIPRRSTDFPHPGPSAVEREQREGCEPVFAHIVVADVRQAGGQMLGGRRFG